ncbi:uncharacterized protein LOC143689045 isoform X1 [Tamandua tetradactyla]|uniref:uncharacterized protein LOC143689045 isoform X1 n=1 Tax=Tamandua tetradactyla TaxID=48850 RepID=UPI00405419E9
MGCRTSKTSDFNSRELVLHSGRCWKYGDEYALESISKRSEAIATEKKTRDFGYRDGLSSPLPSGGVQGNPSPKLDQMVFPSEDQFKPRAWTNSDEGGRVLQA